jgi:hypothetical protein
VQAVMDKALARDVSERYQTASEFGRALFGAVEKMPESELTNAFTAVMTPVSAGKTAPQAPVSKPATPGRAVPPTRVAASTPPQSVPGVAPTPAGNRTPMLVAAGVVAVALGVGGYFATKGNAAPNSNGVESQGATTTAVAPPAGRVNLTFAFRVLDSVLNPKANPGPAQARQALALIDSILPVVESDEDVVHLAVRRADAHFVNAAVMQDSAAEVEIRTGCQYLYPVEGRAANLQMYKSQVQFYLYGDPARGLPATCPQP